MDVACKECGAIDAFQLEPATTDRSMDQGELTAAMCKARPNFGEIRKSSKGNHGKYASLETILAATVIPLADQEVDLSFTSEYESGKCYKIARLSHSSGQWRSSRIEMEVEPPRKSKAGFEINNMMQMIGIASSYARRYVLMDLLAIAPDDADSDNTASWQEPPRRQQNSRAPGGTGGQSRPSNGSDVSGRPRPRPKKQTPEQWVRERLIKGDVKGAVKGINKAITKCDPAAPSIGECDSKDRQDFYIFTGRKRADGSRGWPKPEMFRYICDRFAVPPSIDDHEKAFKALPADVLSLLKVFFSTLDPPPLPAEEAAP